MESIGKVDICNGVPCLEVRIRGSCSFLKSVYTASANYKDSAVRVIKTKHPSPPSLGWCIITRKSTYFRAAGAERCIICVQSHLFSASPSPLPHLFIYWACAVLVLLWWQASSTVKVDDRTPECAVPPSILPINVAIDEGMRTRLSTSRQRHGVSGTPDDYSPHRHYCDPLLVIQANCGKTRDKTVDKLSQTNGLVIPIIPPIHIAQLRLSQVHLLSIYGRGNVTLLIARLKQLERDQTIVNMKHMQ
ncbi:hypothetical protein BC629DRAFT_1435957 [Irpex lacteus]|nr:hypothetical protein BC629DRAFT_1435957 [Irpex lacteus]